MVKYVPDDHPIVIISVLRASVSTHTQFYLDNQKPTYKDCLPTLYENLFSESDLDEYLESKTCKDHPVIREEIQRMAQILTETQGAYLRMIKP